MKLFIVALTFLGALSALIWVGVASAIPIVSVAELRKSEIVGAEVEVNDGKIELIESFAPLVFTVVSRSGHGEPVVVESPRPVPENFKLGIDVGLRGRFNQQKNRFVAGVVTTKCPSKYEASKDAGKSGAYAPTPAAPPAATQLR